MKTTLITVVLLACGAALYFFFTTEEPGQSAKVHASGPLDEPAQPAAEQPAGATKPETWEQVAGDLPGDLPGDGLDPRRALSGDDNTEVVFGLSVAKDRNCDIRQHFLPNDDGTVTAAYSCEPREPITGAFDHYTNEELEVLAYADATAAFELGQRLLAGSPREGTVYLLRSIALDRSLDRPDRLYALRRIVDERFKGNAMSSKRALANMHLYNSLGALLDPDYEYFAGQSRRMMRAAGAPPAAVQAVEKRARLTLGKLIDVQREVFGQATIEEDRI